MDAGRKKLWFAAVKPPMYTVAVTPILAGSMAARVDFPDQFEWARLGRFLLGAILILAWENLTNDLFDFETGVDKDKKESVINLLGATRRNKLAVAALAWGLLALGMGIVLSLSRFVSPVDGEVAVDLSVLKIICVAVFGGYLYQGPPFRLGYYGLGEVICFVCWVLGVCAAYTSQIISMAYSWGENGLAVTYRRLVDPTGSPLLVTAVLVALPTSLILLCSHFHQIESDARVGKKSPIVRMGTDVASQFVAYACVLIFVINIGSGFLGFLPYPAAFIPCLSAPLAAKLAAFVRTNHNVPSKVFSAKYVAVRFNFAHGVLLSVGLAWAATIAKYSE
mmetsp:Transcript_17013/g.35320  ORF Transcript_17013/g.35320 Transcript_17013/m.35320 type:complete len:336 (-) Transcript_17013:2428-3435(-)